LPEAKPNDEGIFYPKFDPNAAPKGFLSPKAGVVEPDDA
jgi:hypothetical protein